MIKSLTLANLPKGETATVASLSDSKLSLKLCEMGCLPGKKITLLRIAPFGGPYCIKIGDSTLTMRKDEAATINLSR